MQFGRTCLFYYVSILVLDTVFNVEPIPVIDFGTLTDTDTDIYNRYCIHAVLHLWKKPRGVGPHIAS